MGISSHGEFLYDSVTGLMTYSELREEFGVPPYRINVQEHNMFGVMRGKDVVDILDLGYWNIHGIYEPQVQEWRDDVICERGVVLTEATRLVGVEPLTVKEKALAFAVNHVFCDICPRSEMGVYELVRDGELFDGDVDNEPVIWHPYNEMSCAELFEVLEDMVDELIKSFGGENEA